MAKIATLPTFSAAPNSSQMNDAFEKITTAMSNTLSRDGSLPNSMSADLDLNDNDILNVNNIDVSGALTLNGVVVTSADAIGTSLENSFFVGFASRANLVTWVAANTPVVGTVVGAGGYSYRYIGTGTAISDLAGWVPQGATFPEHFGDVDGTADEVQINLAQVYNNANGLGPVSLAGKTYTIAATVIIRDGTGYIAPAEKATVIKLASGATVSNIIETLGFSSQTGSNLWYKSAGVLTGFYLKNIRVDGTKATATATRGVAIYGKRYFVDGLLIHDVSGTGYYSECANTGGQQTWDDMPEASIVSVYIKDCGSHGFDYRGPHDGWADRIYIATCGGDGARFTTNSTTDNGACKVGYMHSYANLRGFYINTIVLANNLETESNDNEGLVAETSGIFVDHIHSYANWKDYSASEAPATSAHIALRCVSQIGSISSRTDWGGTALSITGPGTQIGHAVLDGQNTSGIGASVDANQVFLDARVFGFDGGTGTGVKLSASSEINGCTIRFTSRNCNTHLNNVYAGNQVRIEGDIYTITGEVPIAGVAFGSKGITSVFSRGTTVAATRANGTATILSGNSSVVVTHGLAFTPQIGNITITPNSSMSGVSPFHISAIGATTFQINVPSAVGSDKVFGWSASN